MASDAIPALIFLPLLAALAAAVLPARFGRAAAVLCAIALPLLLLPLTLHVLEHGVLSYALAAHDAPLGIRLQAGGLSLLLLWLVAAVTLAATVHAAISIGGRADSRRFWPAWLILLAGLNTLLLSADLFNLYVGIELMTLAAVALVAYGGSTSALRAAMRYLLLAMLGSLVYLLGVALVYAATGTLDIALARTRMPDGIVRDAALALMTGGLLVKSAIFPLHGWLVPAHSSAPGPVSAVLSALVVKATLFLVYRVWFELMPTVPAPEAGALMAALGCGAIVYGSVLAFRQRRLKRLIAYSTVAQLGYLMLFFGMPSEAAWQGTAYYALSHGLAKAAMFLAAANITHAVGSDLLTRLRGIDTRLPISAFAFALAGVSLMGLPPSGGFLGKWLLLTAAWQQQQWAYVAIVLLGSLLAALYLFRVLALMFLRPPADLRAAKGRTPGRLPELAALALAALAVAAGFASAPVLELLGASPFVPGGAP